MGDPEAGVVVTLDRRGPVAWITLDRPQSMNAIDRNLAAQLGTAVEEAAADPRVRVLVITGSGRAFSAGADLKALAPPDGELGAEAIVTFVARAAAVIEAVATVPKPVIAAVNGLALAGGLELALACDLIIASDQAQLGDAHANYGLLPGAGGSIRLARRVGVPAAKRLMFSGDILAATDLVAWGLVDEVVPADRLLARVGALAATLAAKSPAGLAAMKRLADLALDLSLTDGLEAERRELAPHVHSPDLAEGLAAFRSRRPPVFGAAPAPFAATRES